MGLSFGYASAMPLIPGQVLGDMEGTGWPLISVLMAVALWK